jgi:MYXO-CTERM domain-containing protein
VASTHVAQADVGIVKVSPSAGVAGDTVEVTVGCGYCFPPCSETPRAANATCMPSRRARPPEKYSFPILLVPHRVQLAPHRCAVINHRTKHRVEGLCAPVSVGLPRRRPFTYLGRALPASSRDDLEQPGAFPRYRLRFRIPTIEPGLYRLVICEGCDRGRRGSLITYPLHRRYSLRVRQPDPVASSGDDATAWVGGGAAALALFGMALVYRRRATPHLRQQG